MTSFERWLTDHGLASLHPLLDENDIDLDIIADVSEEEFERMGVSLGQRKRLLRAITTLDNANVSAVSIDKPVNIAKSPEQPSKTAAIAPLKNLEASTPERRQLSVLFCDLVGSTELSLELDLEDLRDALLDYQETVSRLFEAHRGFIARYMGDGVLVYFGYPVAMEDDAYSAVLAAQEILNTFQQSPRFVDAGFKVRIGIATGLVLAGEIIGSGASEEHTVLGKTPNLAARLQGVAGPNQMVIDTQTWGLIRRRYTANELESLPLKGFSKPITAYEIPVQQPRSIFTPPVDYNLIGREIEMQALRNAWQETCTSESRFVLIDGEPGIGKSRLIREFRSKLDESDNHFIQWECSHHATNTAFFTIIQYLQEACGFKATDPLIQKRDAVISSAKTLALSDAEARRLVQVLSMADLDSNSEAATPAERRLELIELIIEMLTRMAAQQPMLLVIENIHSIDPSTLDMLQVLMTRIVELPIMVIASCRPEFDPVVVNSSVQHLLLEPLNDQECVDLISELGKLPNSLAQEILAKADGIPLYIEEITLALFDEATQRLTMDGTRDAIPSSLQSLLMAKLDRLGPARELAQLAAVIGDAIDLDLLRRLSGLSSDLLQRHLETLSNAGVLIHTKPQEHERLRFQHALVQEIAYQTLLRDDRRRLHFLVGETIRDQQPELASSYPERVARHFTAAHASEEAIEYWHLAATRASALSANDECMVHLEAAKALLPKLSGDSIRDRYELEINIVHGSVLRGTKGPASDAIAVVYKRSLALCEALGETGQLIPSLIGLYAYNLLRTHNAKAMKYANRLLVLANDSGDVTSRMVGHRAKGAVSFNTGDLQQANEHLQKSRALYDSALHDNSASTVGVDHLQVATSFYCATLCVQGYPITAQQLHNKELQRATELGHANNLAQALVFAAFHTDLSARHHVVDYCGQLYELASEYGFPMMVASALFFKGSIKYYRGNPATALPEMIDALEYYQSTGTLNYVPYFQIRIAECYLALDEFESARSYLDQAQEGVERTGEYWCQAEWLRLSGVYERVVNSNIEAEKAFYHRAIADAESRGAMLWLFRSLLSFKATTVDADEQQTCRNKIEQLVKDRPELSDSYFLHPIQTV